MCSTFGYKTRQSLSVLHSCLGFGNPSGNPSGNSCRRLRTNNGQKNGPGISENGVGAFCIGAEDTKIMVRIFIIWCLVVNYDEMCWESVGNKSFYKHFRYISKKEKRH